MLPRHDDDASTPSLSPSSIRKQRRHRCDNDDTTTMHHPPPFLPQRVETITQRARLCALCSRCCRLLSLSSRHHSSSPSVLSCRCRLVAIALSKSPSPACRSDHAMLITHLSCIPAPAPVSFPTGYSQAGLSRISLSFRANPVPRQEIICIKI